MKPPAPRTVIARNTSAAEAGSIHDDAVAAQMGYRGGLVPGVTLLAYLTPVLIDAYDPAWVRCGTLEIRFVRPAYDGERLTIAAERVDEGALRCRIDGEDGRICAEGGARLDAPDQPARPWRTSVPVPGPAILIGGALPPLEPERLAVGQDLSPLTYRMSLAEAAAWAEDAGDSSAWYRDASPFDGPVVHPALFARDAIRLLRHNFAYKAIVHAESALVYRAAGLVDREYTAYGYIAALHERKGNSYAAVESLTVDQEGREILRHRMTAAIRVRAVAGRP